MRNVFFVALILFTVACGNNVKTETDKDIIADSVRVASDSLREKTDSSVIDIHLKSVMDTLKPIFGYRFTIKGDFDGDGKQETLTEHLISQLDHKETNKYYSNLDAEQTIDLVKQKEPLCFISSSTDKVDSLFVSAERQLFGLALLHNEGDLDGNGTDEISYVIDFADWSNVNSCHIMTFTKKGWKELLNFHIHESNIPDAPETLVAYGLFGVDHREYYENDTLNQRLDEQLKEFSFIRKIKKDVVEVYELSMEDNDSVAMGDDHKKIYYLKK